MAMPRAEFRQTCLTLLDAISGELTRSDFVKTYVDDIAQGRSARAGLADTIPTTAPQLVMPPPLVQDDDVTMIELELFSPPSDFEDSPTPPTSIDWDSSTLESLTWDTTSLDSRLVEAERLIDLDFLLEWRSG